MADEKTLFEQVTALYNVITKKITPVEKATFVIRPAVSHGDIEIFLNGRLYYTSSRHMAVVLAEGKLENFVDGLLLRLRGQKMPWSEQEKSYELRDVAREINFVLVNLASELLTPEQERELDDIIDHEVCQQFKLIQPPKEYTTAHYQFINVLMAREIAKMARGVSTYGR